MKLMTSVSFLNSPKFTIKPCPIPKFSDCVTDTITAVIPTNLIIDLEKFFQYIPIHDYIQVQKRRHKKHQNSFYIDPNRFIPIGSIIYMRWCTLIRGTNPNPKKKKPSTRHLRKSIIVSVYMGVHMGNSKIINIKVPSTGKMHLTGALSINHAIETVKHIYRQMIETEEWIGTSMFFGTKEIEGDTTCISRGLEALFASVMTNLGFSLPFAIDRTALDQFLTFNSEVSSVFEPSFRIVCVNAKVAANQKWDDKIDRLRISEDGEIEIDKIDYQYYFKTLKPQSQEELLHKQHWHTFLIFSSGNCIFTSSGSEMPVVFEKFVNLLVNNRELIEDKDYYG
jgi:hypothetical protein